MALAAVVALIVPPFAAQMGEAYREFACMV